MGRTSFARGPYDTRGRSAQQGPKRLALPRGNATGVVPPRKGSPPHRAVGTGGSEECGVGNAVGGRAVGLGSQDHLPQEPPIYSLLTDPDRTESATTACGQQNTLWTTTRQPTQPAPGHSDPAVPTRPPSGPAPTHRTSPWTVGPAGANPASVRSAPTHPPSTWTLGMAGAIPARSRLPCQPSAWTVGLAGAKCSMGWTCFVWGSGTRSVSARQGQSFRPLLCGPATGVVGAPRKTGPPHRAKLENRGSGPMLPPGNEASDPRVAELAVRRRGRPARREVVATRLGRPGGPL
ncbi:hypothetical protein LV75_004669 [Actinokineospora diospyrosa]|uniref:Uncharacterized protein n=1 Tax=Actinokineospora diospyrosa TaxID=103728 RepID=A0ABT1IHN6_9PSEU|nr:hypothetical protein [Actinokineospora diospyrosa]